MEIMELIKDILVVEYDKELTDEDSINRNNIFGDIIFYIINKYMEPSKALDWITALSTLVLSYHPDLLVKEIEAINQFICNERRTNNKMMYG